MAPHIRVFTLDTGRLNDETYEVMEATRFKYPDVPIEVMFPDRDKVEALTREKGFFSFRDSVELRKECCAIRKVQPLKRALSDARAWMTGLRRDQSVTRTDTPAIEWDEGNGMVKVNPIIEWSNDDVWAYIKDEQDPLQQAARQGLPEHRLRALHARDQGRRGHPRRPLVVGEPRVQGVRPARVARGPNRICDVPPARLRDAPLGRPAGASLQHLERKSNDL